MSRLAWWDAINQFYMIMTKILSKSSFKFFEIKEDCRENFKEVKYPDLSDFHMNALTWIGDAIRGPKSQHFWCNGCYCWYVDEKQSHEQGVWMTQNGIAMFEDITEKKLYRIEFV